jgi:hypothetical protein
LIVMRITLTVPWAVSLDGHARTLQSRIADTRSAAGFTITVSGLSGANTMRAVHDVFDRPADPQAQSRFLAALALCCGQSTEGVEHFKLTPIQRF